MREKADRTSDEAGPGTELVKAPRDGTAPHAIRQREGAVSGAAGHDEPARTAMGGVFTYLHAFRRHWPLAITLGLVCGAAAAVAAWFVATERYTANALLQISANQTNIVFNHNGDSSSSFEVFKGTQQQMLTSDVVLVAALRKPEAASLAAVRKEDDPVRWLARNLRVDFPGTPRSCASA